MFISCYWECRAVKHLRTASIYAGVILLLPLVIDVFSTAGSVLLGTELVQAHAWLPTVLAYTPLLVLLWIYAFSSLKRKEHFGFIWSRKLLLTSLGIGVLSAFVLYGVDILTGTLAQFGAPRNPAPLAAGGFLISWGLLAPFVEEFFFRGMIQTSFADMESKAWIHPSIWITACMEMLFHYSFPLYQAAPGEVLSTMLATTPQALYVGVFSFAASWIFFKTKSLVGPFIIHALGNIGELLLYWAFNG